MLQKERRLTGLHKDIEEILFDAGFDGAVGAYHSPLAAASAALEVSPAMKSY